MALEYNVKCVSDVLVICNRFMQRSNWTAVVPQLQCEDSHLSRLFIPHQVSVLYTQRKKAYIASQAATAAAALMYVTDRAGVHPISRRLSPPHRLWPTTKQPYAALDCHF